MIEIPKQGAAFFASDLHLSEETPRTLEAFESWLASVAQANTLVFLLGDVFEVWYGDDYSDPTTERVAHAIQSAHATGAKVYFMHGNRDFLAGPGFLAQCGITGLADPTVLVFGGQRFVLSHGDLLCLDDVEYQRFRVQARSAEWQRQFLAQPLATRRAQARGIRQESEARKQSGVTYADVDGPAAITWLQAAQAHTLIHGHTHRPADHALGQAQRHVLSDWSLDHAPLRAQVFRLQRDGGSQRIDWL